MINLKKILKMLLAIATCFIFFASLLLLTQYSRASGEKKIKINGSEENLSKDYIIPNLIGEKYSSIADDNIIKVRDEYNDDFNEGYVISQSISPGTRKSGNDIIEVIVSKGTALRTLPNIEGKSISDATKQLSDIGFTPTAKRIENNEKNDIVIGYSDGYKPGNSVRVDKKISIDVAVN